MKKLTLLALLLTVSACGTPKGPNHQVLEAISAQTPYYDPELDSNSVTVQNVVVSSKVISKNQQEQVFASNLDRMDIIPVLVSIVNNNKSKVLVHGMSAKIIEPEQEIEPLNIEQVIEGIKGNHEFTGMKIANVISLGAGSGDINNLSQQRDEAIRNNILTRLLPETVLLPGQSTSGFVFFYKKNLTESSPKISFDIQMMDILSYQTINALIQDASGITPVAKKRETITQEEPTRPFLEQEEKVEVEVEPKKVEVEEPTKSKRSDKQDNLARRRGSIRF